MDNRTLLYLATDDERFGPWIYNRRRQSQLTKLRPGFVIGDFDISLDRREIIFDLAREESNIVLFELPDR